MSQTDPAPEYDRFQVFPTEEGNRTRYKWRLHSADGDMCLVSGTAYTVKSEAHHNALTVKAVASRAVVEDVTG